MTREIIERDGFDRLEDITFREQVEEEAKSQSEKVKYGRSPSSIGDCIRIEDIDSLRLPKALALCGQMKVLK